MAPVGVIDGDADRALEAGPERPPGLELHYRSVAAPELAPGWPLLTVRFGQVAAAEPATTGLTVDVPLPQIGEGLLEEVWSTPLRPVVERRGQVSVALAGPTFVAAVDRTVGVAGELEDATRDTYRNLLRAAREAGCPHPLRFWNVVPEINATEQGLERYQRFCRARAEAFEEELGPRFERSLCASSAVGSSAGRLVIYLLASRDPGAHRENPRQVSAYQYPPEYGPRSPSFARATRCPEALGGVLLLSGTASIVGHRTLHPDCSGCQLRETLSNLGLIATPSGVGSPPPYRALKVYLRDPAHFPSIRQQLKRELSPELPVLYLQADICRRELLLEIEGVA